MTDNPPAIILRCNACGAVSTVLAEGNGPTENRKPDMDDVTVELEVIQAVGRALARLPDADAQKRVINWINDRFQSASTPVASTRGGHGDTVIADAQLAVEELSEFFEQPVTVARTAPPVTLHREAAEPEPAGIDALVRGFVSDFQRVALEWQGA